MTYVDTTKTINHVSLCAGYGGIDLGLKRAIGNVRTVAFCEIEAYACANLVAKMEEGLLDPAPIWTNLKTFPWAEFRGKVGILSGGYPCQPFSAAGKRLGKDDPRHLWPYIREGINAMRPAVCFFENVEGHISLGLSTVISDLEEDGYKCSWGIFSASEVGAPHQRKRIFIMGYSEHDGLSTLEKLRSYEKASDYRGTEESRETGQFEGTSRPIDVSSLSGCQSRSELANNNGQGLEGYISELLDSQGWQEQGRPTSSGSGAVADTDSNGSGEDRQSAELWTSGAEQPSSHSGITRQGQTGEGWQAWPSRPGQPQYEWEPPRVVANPGHDTSERWGGVGQVQEGYGCTETEGQGSRTERKRKKSESLCSSAEPTMGNSTGSRLERTAGESVQGGVCGLASDGGADTVGDTTSQRLCGGQADGLGQQSEVLGARLETMGNPNSGGLEGSSQVGGRTNDAMRSSGETMVDTTSRSNGQQPTEQQGRDTTRRPSQEGTVENPSSVRWGGGSQNGGGREGRPTAETTLEGYSQPRDIGNIQNEIKSSLGGNPHGTSSGMGYAELCVSSDNRIDELRLLGNGVVPQTCERAFRTLIAKI